MRISVRKVQTIFQLKLRLILSNLSIMVAPILPILFVITLKASIQNGGAGQGLDAKAFILSFGLVFNVVMSGIMLGSYPLAEEKEKHTLRVLMTSSVNSGEYFLGSLLPTLLITILINFILVPLSGNSFARIPIGGFTVMTTVTAITSIVIGYAVGLFAKSQMQAGILSMPLLLTLTIVPFFSVFNATLKNISGFVYSGVVSKYVNHVTTAQGYHWNLNDSGVLIGWLLGSICLFAYAYHVNGLEND